MGIDDLKNQAARQSEGRAKSNVPTPNDLAERARAAAQRAKENAARTAGEARDRAEEPRDNDS
ncbi:hypothetical protein BIV57_19665 [Mangrovactinospora gilvigrisea]|uniref:Uncharacterized protein n=1 Tax=Mangrovactinospora gilvigrisea TaxID=1428644 RepID=A0A1J7BAZ7_9ACTN|nr:hypothetical protein [Mangrovactinospora gilvigrisea]OIV35790.1 hypothetical protein BIV57_19665 [Mangrovactinospora gilvigrisea]